MTDYLCNNRYYTTCEISSANMGFWGANIGRYYTGQQLIAELLDIFTSLKYKDE